MRAANGCAAAVGSLLLMISVAGCEARNLGAPPPGERFFFPSGVLLDPVARVESPQCDGSTLPPAELDLPGPRYLYVANGNNDRSYNAGTLLAIDLQAFWRAWYDPHRDDPAQAGCLEALESGDAQAACEACAARDPRRGGVDPYCHDVATADGTHERCVLPPGSPITQRGGQPAARPCRRLPLIPSVAECDERSFVADVVRVGDFATTMAYSLEDEGVRLWLPVRGDPSITYVDVRTEDGKIALECDQGDEPLDPELCGDSHRLDDLRNDPELDPIAREPFNVAIWERDPPSPDPDARGQRLAFVAHADGSQLSMVDLDGVLGSSEPAIVDFADVYQTGGGAAGGYGLAVRPCFAAGQGPFGADDPVANVPALTQECTRPLVYTSFRFSAQLASFTASGLELGAGVAERVPPSERTDCMVPLLDVCELSGQGDAATLDCVEGIEPQIEPGVAAEQCRTGECEVYAGQYCATPPQLDQPCAIPCEPQVRGARRIQPSILLDTSGTSSAVLGALAFADPRGDQLLVLQTNPGALLSLDTSIGDGAEPLDIPSAPPVEICAEPSNMKIYVERDAAGLPVQRYAIISCFRAALVYVVDLEALRVVDAVVVGTGPHDIAIDDAREVAYVINNLESSISVIDLSRRRATRFQELARLGLQDPFSQ
jgi:hypothetical protein